MLDWRKYEILEMQQPDGMILPRLSQPNDENVALVNFKVVHSRGVINTSEFLAVGQHSLSVLNMYKAIMLPAILYGRGKQGVGVGLGTGCFRTGYCVKKVTGWWTKWRHDVRHQILPA
jgi:hypothetical protein